MSNNVGSTVGELGMLVTEFMLEANEGLKPNKAAAKRARKLSLEIGKQLKLYRQQSV